MKGKFIAIYGINNIGKTTQARRLVARLKKLGKRAIYIKYPIYNQKPTGPFINSVLRSHKNQKISEEELQMWFTLNRYQFQPKLIKLLEKGINVIAEDYIGTGIAWGSAKGANPDFLENLNKFLVQEDLGLLMDGKRVLSAKEKRHLHEKNDKLAEKCQKIYRKLAKKFGWKLINVSADWDVTSARIWAAVKKKIP